MNKITIRSMGVALLCSHLLKKVCENVKYDSEIYHLRTKKILNNLLETVDMALSKAYNVQTIKRASQYLNRELEGEIVEDEIVTNAEIIELIAEILMDMDQRQVYDAHLLLKNIKQGKRLYTEEELNKFLEEAQQSVSEHYIKKYES